jgi:hypothetical protein
VKRKTLDLILTAIGGVMTVVLIVAGSLLMWGSNFASNNVHSQLAMQQIYFPTQAQLNNAKAGTEVTPQMVAYLAPYAGQQVLTGAQAEVYADHFIANHLYAMPYHGVYADVSAAARANPTDTKLAQLEQTTFQGTTLRGLLLEAYAFSQFGEIAFVASIASFALAGVMLVLTILGLVHYRRVGEQVEFPKLHESGRVEQAA